MERQHALLRTLHINIGRLVRSHLRGNYKSAFKGQGIVMANSRPYVAGDDFRHMDRRTSAKKGELYVKEFEEERQLKLFFVVDTGASMDFHTQKKTKRMLAQDVVSLLGSVALQQGDRVGGTFFASDKGTWWNPSRHRATLYSLLQKIEHHDNKENSLRENLEDIRRHRIANCLLIFLSDDFPAHEDYLLLRGVAYKNELLRIHLFDPFEVTLESEVQRFVLADARQTTSAYFTEKVRTQYRENLVREQKNLSSFLRSIGGQYICLTTDDDPVVRLAEHFQRASLMKRR